MGLRRRDDVILCDIGGYGGYQQALISRDTILSPRDSVGWKERAYIGTKLSRVDKSHELIACCITADHEASETGYKSPPRYWWVRKGVRRRPTGTNGTRYDAVTWGPEWRRPESWYMYALVTLDERRRSTPGCA